MWILRRYSQCTLCETLGGLHSVTYVDPTVELTVYIIWILRWYSQCNLCGSYGGTHSVHYVNPEVVFPV